MVNIGARAAQDDESALHVLGDFTANARLILLSSIAIVIGISARTLRSRSWR